MIVSLLNAYLCGSVIFAALWVLAKAQDRRRGW